jgi:hypothetical protein
MVHRLPVDDEKGTTWLLSVNSFLICKTAEIPNNIHVL